MKKKYFPRYLKSGWIPGVTTEWSLASMFLLLFSIHSQAAAPAVKDDPFNKEVRIESNALQQTVTGTVLDNQGLPLPGANILEKGTSNGVMSDFDGNFSIEVGDDAVLVISYIGYKTQEVQVDDLTVLTVHMAEDAAGLEEVVVVGYGWGDG